MDSQETAIPLLAESVATSASMAPEVSSSPVPSTSVEPDKPTNLKMTPKEGNKAYVQL